MFQVELESDRSMQLVGEIFHMKGRRMKLRRRKLGLASASGWWKGRKGEAWKMKTQRRWKKWQRIEHWYGIFWKLLKIILASFDSLLLTTAENDKEFCKVGEEMSIFERRIVLEFCIVHKTEQCLLFEI